MKTLTQTNSPEQKFWQLDAQLSQNPTEIAIIDTAITDLEHLLGGIKPGTATYSLDNQTDAVEQIAKILAQHTNIQNLHIISHGSPGNLYLGTTALNSSNIKNYSPQLQKWRNALTPNASIILYGCNLAAGDAGNQFLTQLNQLTGANIAANTQPTGNSKLGGNWEIQQLIPPSPQKPKLALTETTLKTYSGVLGFAPRLTSQLAMAPSPSASATSTATGNLT
ncbi:MAG: DUF4347 domain-containing protein [Microcoleus sp. CAN_BIN18]|nr:DUF4347 domain-containing protein [Microcoleus sp. CAN_BIN18]